MSNRTRFALVVILSSAISFSCASKDEPNENVEIIEEENENNVEQQNNVQEEEEETRVVSETSVQPWVVSGTAVETYVQTRDAVLLDARDRDAFDADSIPGFQHADWQMFSKTEPADRGELLPIDQLADVLTDLGVTEDKWVYVIGDPQDGWGEDGRIVWMLHAIGHNKAAFIDGGYALAKAISADQEPNEEPGEEPTTMTDDTFEPTVSEYKFTANADDVLAAIESDVELIDVRELREFEGETPYGETRGGHVPTAKHLHYKSLVDENGELLSEEGILAALAEAGIDTSKPIIAYCTGGVRSGWLASVLRAIGLDATNYAGSMWQWSSYPAADYPLE